MRRDSLTVAVILVVVVFIPYVDGSMGTGLGGKTKISLCSFISAHVWRSVRRNVMIIWIIKGEQHGC